MKTRDVRLRFAPSPSGKLHVGNARTALFNYLCARSLGGSFVLRIEDTDRERSSVQSEKSILEDLAWLGLEWDEGPDRGGPYGPYRQSERLGLYRMHADRLRAAGRAYYCFCPPGELEEKRKRDLKTGEVKGYGGTCRAITSGEAERRVAAGEPAALRFAVQDGTVEIEDLVRGKVTFDTGQFGDFVILRSNGIPAYNFAVVSDDQAMNISHVIRGEDHLTNTARQILLYQALDCIPPLFAHAPMILGSDHSRLSKRSGAVSVSQYRRDGILPQALSNFLALQGWSPGDDREVLSREELVRDFSIERISKSASVFNPDKLLWMNGLYLRETPPGEFWETAGSYLAEAGFFPASRLPEMKDQLLAVVDLCRNNLKTLKDLVGYGALFFRENPGYSAEALERLRTPESRRILEALLERLGTIDSSSPEAFREIMKAIQKELPVKGNILYPTVRMAVSGQKHGPELDRLFTVIGAPLVKRRIMKALELLGTDEGAGKG